MMRLAQAAGRLDVDRAFDEISAQEYAELEAFNELEPLNMQTLCGLVAFVATLLINQWGGEGEPVTERDIVAYVASLVTEGKWTPKKPKRMTAAETRAAVRAALGR